MIEVLEHATLADNVADALRPYNCDTALATGPCIYLHLCLEDPRT